MTKPVIQFSIHYYQYLNHLGQLTESLPSEITQSEHLISLYRMMVLTRTFDSKAIALQRTGKLRTYPSSLGQEAISIGIGSALQREDVFCHAYRGYGAQLLRGVRMEEILSFWGGSEQGNNYEASSAKEDFPNCIPIGSQCLHAAGIATAMKLRNQARATLVVCGDGATSEGDFYEAVNLAGVWHLPLVFVIENNQWAISVSRQAQSAAQTLAQKAIAGGISGEQVDGNDVIAIKARVKTALDKARKGDGPTLIEALTYRLSDHTTADDASRYRSKEDVIEAWKYDPIFRLQQYLYTQRYWSEDQEKILQEECTQQVEQAVQTYLNSSPAAPEEMFDYHYAKLPDMLRKQKEICLTKVK